MKKFLCLLLCLCLTCFGLVACKDPETPVPPGPDSDMSLEKYVAGNAMERNYAYMWLRDGLRNSEMRAAFQTEDYAFLVNSVTGKMLRAGTVDSEERFVECDFDKLDETEMHFYSRIGDAEDYEESKDTSGTTRLIESGRYVNSLDFNNIRFQSQGTNRTGRIVYTGTVSHAAMTYQLHSKDATSADLKFSFAMDGYTAAEIADGRGYTYVNAEGDGFAFLTAKGDETARISNENGTLIFEKTGISVPKAKHTGFTIIVIPVKGNSDEKILDYLEVEKLQISATNVLTGGTLDVTFDSSKGVFEIDTDPVSPGSNMQDDNIRKAMERIRFVIGNTGERDVSPILNFEKTTSAFSITGMSPVIRDENQEQTGEQVQISKNWHAADHVQGSPYYKPADDPNRADEGPWYRGFTSIPAESREETVREYVLVYGYWGSLPAAAHAQLGLIGYGGNQCWDQSSLGSWGESITYDPDVCLNRSMVDDVRPLFVTAPTGQNQQYSWSGNIGGADFLVYLEDAPQNLINQRITYYTQAPNVTNVNYSGWTANKKIASSITINMGRTDDIVRTFYTLKYTFLEDVEYGKLAFFQMAADGYATSYYSKYALGDEDGIIEKDQAAMGHSFGNIGEAKDARGQQFWFACYDSSSADQHASIMYTVRSFRADVNGKTYDKPGYQLTGTENGPTQTACQVVLPTSVGNKIAKGSTVEMVIEYALVPTHAESYYGACDYILQTAELMNTAEANYQQVVAGTVKPAASVGEVISAYPLRIKAGKQGEVAAQFTVNGGLGYLPLLIDGLPGYSGYQLQQKVDGSWVDINQSLTGGTDYYQAKENADGTYQLGFNIKNTTDLNFNVTNEYRLIQRG